jgi:hypothetical protein
MLNNNSYITKDKIPKKRIIIFDLIFSVLYFQSYENALKTEEFIKKTENRKIFKN